MARSQINLRIPVQEREAARSTARAYGLTLSLYIRSLMAQDREELEREQLLTSIYPQKALKSH